MDLIVGKTAGFCGGVINSVNVTSKVLDENGKTYCLGELVHNKQVVEELENKGLEVIESLDDIYDSKVIVRAHGIPNYIYDLAKEHNIDLVDLTCPNVLMVHKVAEEYRDTGYFIVLVAQKSHPEAIGTISFCGNDSFIVESKDDLEELYNLINKTECKKIAIIAQTTYSLEKFDDICKLIKEHVDKEVVINNTICLATSRRQKETIDLAKSVDAMIIAGGKNSSNTKKLYDVALNGCKNVYIVETVDDLDKDTIAVIKTFNKVGLMAGASTPKKSIDDICELFK